MRSDNPKPNAIQVKNSIKNVAISEYLSLPVTKSSYFWDESEFLAGFLNIVRSVKEKNIANVQRVRASDKAELSSHVFDSSKAVINQRERNVLYKICCYI